MAAREKMAEIIFDKFGVKGIYFANGAVTTLYATGRMAGVVLKAGEGVIHAVPVHQGFAVPKAIIRWGFGGNGQSQYLSKLLSEKGYNLSAEPEALREIKEQVCYVAADFKQEMTKSTDPSLQKTVKLSDGKVVTLGNEMFKSSEILFQPSVGGMSSAGVPGILNEAISKCTADQQHTMIKNIVLGGGPTLMRGFPERLTKEMKSLVGNDVDVVAAGPRLNSAWIGGSILAKMDTFQSMWVTRNEYKDKGNAIIHDRCK